MVTLADEDLFTLASDLHGRALRPSRRRAIARPSWGCRSIAASIRFASARAADPMPYACNRR